MIKFVLGLVLCLGFGSLMPSAHAESEVRFDHAQVARRALEHHIRPLVADVRKEFSGLVVATGACTNTVDFNYAALMPTFRRAVLSWGRMAHLTFGPLAQKNRYERVYFWLDRKSIGRRQVARALKAAPGAYTDAKQLGARSVGVQGLPALEQLIVLPAGANEDAAFKCAYAQAIAQNVLDIIVDVATEWGDGGSWARLWLTAGPGNTRFLAPRETTYTLMRAFLEHIERARDVELLRPLGFAVRNRRLPGPFARSDLTMAFLSARIDGLRSLVEASGLADETLTVATARKSPEASDAMTQVRSELRQLHELTTAFATRRRFFDDDRRLDAVALGFPMKSARQLATRAFALTTKIPLGFNATDGD